MITHLSRVAPPIQYRSAQPVAMKKVYVATKHLPRLMVKPAFERNVSTLLRQFPA